MSGDLKDWLPFWAQFIRIDEDQDIDDIDKYHYLVQAIVPNSRARQIRESYPATSGNYSKALQNLKNRFGKRRPFNRGLRKRAFKISAK